MKQSLSSSETPFILRNTQGHFPLFHSIILQKRSYIV